MEAVTSAERIAHAVARAPIRALRTRPNRQQRQTFHFDSVFTSFSTQREVFETVRALVNEVMQGFEATVRSALITESSAPSN